MQLTGARSWEEQIQALPAQEVSDFPSPVAGKLVRGWPYRSARERFPKSLSCLWLPLQSMEVVWVTYQPEHWGLPSLHVSPKHLTSGGVISEKPAELCWKGFWEKLW